MLFYRRVDKVTIVEDTSSEHPPHTTKERSTHPFTQSLLHFVSKKSPVTLDVTAKKEHAVYVDRTHDLQISID